MPTGHTQLTIYNAALDMVSSRPVTSPAEVSPEARWLNRNYEHYVRAALRTEAWNFARELHELDRRVVEPAFRWRWGFDLPIGWLRVLPPTTDGTLLGRPIKYAVASDVLYTNHEGVKAELIMDRQDPGTWDPLFADYVAARLAYGLSHSLTHKASFKAETKQAVQDAFDVAQSANAFESPTDDIEQFDIIRVRSQ